MQDARTLQDIIALGREISQINDLDVLLERILTVARQIVNADAGSIYLREGDRLKFNYTQNATMQAKLPAGRKLIYGTFTIPIDSHSIAGHVANVAKLLNIPDAYLIPADAPYSFDRKYDEVSGYRTSSMLTAPIVSHTGKVIGVLQLINAKDTEGNSIPFNRDLEPLVEHFADTAAVAIVRAQLTRDIIMRMISMAELRDPKETGPHVNRVAAYSVEIYEQWARKRGFDEAHIQRGRDVLRMASMLHDVGKIAIPDAILKKPGRLTDEEREVMNQHTYMGAKLFSDFYSEFDEASYLVALNHHEKWDGTGYPGHVNPKTGKSMPGYEGQNGKPLTKRGEDIPPFGRVVAIADVYDALSCRRVYKESWDEGRVLETLKQDSGTHFDPEMVEAFFASLDVIRSIASRYPD